MMLSARKMVGPLALLVAVLAGCGNHDSENGNTPPPAPVSSTAAPSPAMPASTPAPGSSAAMPAPAYPQSSPAPATTTH